MSLPRLELLFPTPLVIARIEKHEEYKNKILPLLEQEFKKNPEKSAPWSQLCHTWQLFSKDDEFYIWDQQINKLVYDFLHYLYKYPIEEKIKIESWFNVHDQNMYQETHNHSPLTISGIYYLQLNKNSLPVTFLNPAVEELNLIQQEYSCKEIMLNTFPNKLNISEGDLILFPSHLKHLVVRSGCKDKLRISYSFNVQTSHHLS